LTFSLLGIIIRIMYVYTCREVHNAKETDPYH
jgi:hypothetical protein